jgi:hypothetical protein
MSKLMEGRRAKIARAGAEYLGEGEVVQAAIFAQNARGGALAGKYYFIVATNERIIVFNARKSGVFKVAGIEREVPREIQIGPPKGNGSLTRTWYRTEALGMQVFIPRPYWSEVRAADAALPA